MELRSIQYFVQVADEGSITRTAEKIGIAQPALSRHIQHLEEELGTQLLTRLPRGVRLTTSGRDFLDHARAIVLDVTRASEQVRGKARAARGTVVMGTSPTVAPLLLPGCVARARDQCPGVTLKVIEGFSPQLLDALLTGRLQVAVMTNPPRTTSLAMTPLCSEPLAVVARPGGRGTRRAFSLPELRATPFFLTAGIRTLLEQQLEAFGVQLRIAAERRSPGRLSHRGREPAPHPGARAAGRRDALGRHRRDRAHRARRDGAPARGGRVPHARGRLDEAGQAFASDARWIAAYFSGSCLNAVQHPSQQK